MRFQTIPDRSGPENGHAQVIIYTGHLLKCDIYTFIFHKDHFKTNLSFLTASVQILQCIIRFWTILDRSGHENRHAQVAMYTGHLRKCHIYIFIFHKDHFKPNMSFLSASVQILAVKTHVFWDFGPVRTKRAEGLS